MRIQVRQSVFETNSSSTHAICIAKGYEKPEAGTIFNFNLDEFGWEYDKIYVDDYLYTLSVYLGKEEEFKKYVTEALEEFGCTAEFEEPEESRWHYIDHGDAASKFFDWVMKDKKHLYRCILNKDSFIQTGNDNDDSYDVVMKTYEDWKGMKFLKNN